MALKDFFSKKTPANTKTPHTENSGGSIKREVLDSGLDLALGAVLGNLYNSGQGLLFNSSRSTEQQKIDNTGMNTVLSSITAFKDVMDDEYKKVKQLVTNPVGSTGIIVQNLKPIDYKAPMGDIVRTLDANIILINRKTQALDIKLSSTKMLVDYNNTLLSRANLVLNDIKQYADQQKYKSIENSIESRNNTSNKSESISPNALNSINMFLTNFSQQVNDRLTNLEKNQSKTSTNMNDIAKLAVLEAAETAEGIAKSTVGKVLGGAALGGIITGGFEYYETGNAGRAAYKGAGGFAGAAAGAGVGALIGNAPGAIIGGVLGALGAFGGSEVGEYVYDKQVADSINEYESSFEKIESNVIKGINQRNEWVKLLGDIESLESKVVDQQLKDKLSAIKNKLLSLSSTYNIDGASHNSSMKSPTTAATTNVVQTPNNNQSELVTTREGLLTYKQNDDLQAAAKKISDERYYAGFTTTPGNYLLSTDVLNLKGKILNIGFGEIHGLDDIILKTVREAKADLSAPGSDGNGLGYDASDSSGGTTSPSSSLGGSIGGGVSSSPRSTSENNRGARGDSKGLIGTRGADKDYAKPEGDVFGRSKYSKELENSELRERMFAMTMSEVGAGSDPASKRAIMETMFNRSDAHGINSLDKILQRYTQKDKNYYQPYYDGAYDRNLTKLKNDPKLRTEFDKLLDEVIAGSNDSNFGTHNSSADTAADARRTQSVSTVTKSGELISRKDLEAFAGIHGLGTIRKEKSWYDKVYKKYLETKNKTGGNSFGDVMKKSIDDNKDVDKSRPNINDKFGSMENQPNSRIPGRRKGEPGEFNYALTGAFGEAGKGDYVDVTSPSGAKFTVHRDVSKNIEGFITELEERGYKINAKTSYGLSVRPNVNNPSQQSTHGFGGTIDVNSENNPNRTNITDLPKNAEQLAWKYGMSWGAAFGDSMHFEMMSPNARKSKLNKLLKDGFITKEEHEEITKYGYPISKKRKTEETDRKSLTPSEVQKESTRDLEATKTQNPFLKKKYDIDELTKQPDKKYNDAPVGDNQGSMQTSGSSGTRINVATAPGIMDDHFKHIEKLKAKASKAKGREPSLEKNIQTDSYDNVNSNYA